MSPGFLSPGVGLGGGGGGSGAGWEEAKKVSEGSQLSQEVTDDTPTLTNVHAVHLMVTSHLAFKRHEHFFEAYLSIKLASPPRHLIDAICNSIPHMKTIPERVTCFPRHTQHLQEALCILQMQSCGFNLMTRHVCVSSAQTLCDPLSEETAPVSVFARIFFQQMYL